MYYKYLFSLHLSLLVVSCHAMIPYVNPQPGENLWGLVSREGTAIDYLLNQDMAVSNTTINAIYSLVQNINTIVDGCCPCDVFLDSTNTPTIITRKGYYCLAEDISVSGTAIKIAANLTDDIVIDLQGHAIESTGGDGIATGNVNSLIIKNGTIMAAQGTAVNLGAIGTSNNTTVDGITAASCFRGFFSGPNSRNNYYTGCQARLCTTHGFDSNFSLTAQEYYNCIASNNGGNGFNMTGAGLVFAIEQCYSNSNGGFGFYVTAGGFSIMNSTAMHNSRSGFCIIALNGTLNRCTAIGNGSGCNHMNGDGFYLEPTTSGISVISCTSTSNYYGGFHSLSAVNRIFNCFAIRNSTGGGNFNVGGGALVLSYSDLATNNNISWWANINGGFEWNAVCP